MSGKQEKTVLEVVEVRRGVLKVGSIGLKHHVAVLLAHIPHTSDHEFLYLSRESTDQAVQILRQVGIRVLSLEMEIQALRQPISSFSPASSSFGSYLLPEDITSPSENTSWKRYSFNSRRLLSTQPQKNQMGQWTLFLRNDQLVLAVNKQHLLGYYLPRGTSLARHAKPQEALEECHWRSLPAKVYFEIRQTLAPYVVLYPAPHWLPPKHFELLYTGLAGSTGKSKADFVLLHSLDIPLAKQILGSLNIELVEGTPPEKVNAQALEIVEIAAHVAQQAYTAYLKSEKGVQTFGVIVHDRRWELIEPLEFRQLLIDLANRAYDFEPLAEEVLSYLIDRLPRSFDWKGLRDDHARNWLLQGIVLHVDTSLQFGRDTSKYYQIIVQEFGTVLGVMSKRNLLSTESSQEQPTYFLASNWRATPYAGRLKLTGANSSVLFEQATERQIAEEGYSYIYGIPTFEAQLARELYLAAFFLDRDAEYWRGHNEFSRYFAGHGQVVEKIVTDLDEPAVLFQDIFGTFFYLTFSVQEYVECQHLLHADEKGHWLQFVAHAGLRSLLKGDHAFPAFDLISGVTLSVVEPSEVVEATILGLLRYYGQMEKYELQQKLQVSQMVVYSLEKALAKLMDSRRIVRSGDILYYNYTFSSPGERALLVTPETFPAVSLDARLLYGRLKPFLPMLYPLGFGSSLVQPASSSNDQYHQYRKQVLESGDRYSIVVTHGNYQRIMKGALANLKQFGVSVFRAHPWNLKYALTVINHIRSTLTVDEIEIQRKDIIQTYEGKEVIETWLRLFSPDTITRLYFAQLLRRSGIARRVEIERERG